MNNILNFIYSFMEKFVLIRLINRNTKFMIFGTCKLTIMMLIIAISTHNFAIAQNSGSPANWMYPNGNSEATRHVARASSEQNIFNFVLKWQTPEISGDVKPLIGNLVDNERIFNDFPFAPNEIAAILADEIVILDGAGRLVTRQRLPEFVENIKSLSALIDTTGASEAKPPMVLGFETIEVKADENGLIYSYVFGHDKALDSVKVIRRLALNLNPYKPNDFGSIKPVFGKRIDNKTLIYATVDISEPVVNSGTPFEQPYLRGLTQFTITDKDASFPLPDIGDNIDSRTHLAPEIGFSQPSVTQLGTRSVIALPSYPDLSVPATTIIEDPVTNYGSSPERPYFFGYDITNDYVIGEFPPEDLSAFTETRPRIRPFYVDITDGQTAESKFILIAEEYNAIDGSSGVSKLHLHEQDAFAITSYDTNDIVSPPYVGGEDHYWAVAVGNVDGNSNNEWLPYFPNNPGNEIIVTQSSRDFAVPASRLSILRYNSGTPIEKPSPPGQFLYPFDTIATQRVNGWVAAVNDLDGFGDGKEEIILVDGSTFLILQLRDYTDEEFRVGRPLDTLFQYDFPNQTISNVAVADLEGDGRNDIIVTTYDNTYVFGNLIPNTLIVTKPRDLEPGMENYCAGDTVYLEWINLIYGQTEVQLRYQPVDDNDEAILGADITIASSINNMTDTVRYDYAVDSLVIGTRGFFVVESFEKALLLNDSTDILNFEGPQILPDELANNYYRFDDKINLTGTAFCGDSVAVEYQLDDSTWVRFATDSVSEENTYDFIAQVPCIDLFNCEESKLDTNINFRLVNFVGIYADTSAAFRLTLSPAEFPIVIDSNETADPTKVFRWQEDFLYACDAVEISISTDNGANYSEIAIVSLDEIMYSWNVPTEIPDEVMMRFCCVSDPICSRTDTVITGVRPKFIEIVAPNPFNPLREKLTVVYSVPEDSRVSIKIFDAANRLVSEPIKSVDRSPGLAYSDLWDGLRSDGSPVANGMYYLSLEFSSGAREIYPIFVKK